MNVLYPVFILALLTLLVTFRLGASRYRAVVHGEVDPAYYKAYIGGEEPVELRIIARHLTNLLEMPLLFYVACLLAFVTGQTGVLVAGLAWLYAALRLVHSAIHLGRNDVLWRFRVFASSTLVLAVLWLLLYGLLAR